MTRLDRLVTQGLRPILGSTMTDGRVVVTFRKTGCRLSHVAVSLEGTPNLVFQRRRTTISQLFKTDLLTFWFSVVFTSCEGSKRLTLDFCVFFW